MIATCMALIDDPNDKEKFLELYYTYKDLMFKIAMSVLHNENIANETIQDCFLKIAIKISEMPNAGTSKAKALMIIIVKNKSINNLKLEHYDKIEPLNENEVYSGDDLSSIVADYGYNKLVQDILSLDEKYSDILSLRLIYGYSIEEICSLLDIPKRTAESRIYRGRKILKERLEGKEYE